MITMIQLHSLDTLKEQLQQEYPRTFVDNPEFTVGLNSLMKSGLPTPRNEEWKYFPLNALVMTDYASPIEKDGIGKRRLARNPHLVILGACGQLSRRHIQGHYG